VAANERLILTEKMETSVTCSVTLLQPMIVVLLLLLLLLLLIAIDLSLCGSSPYTSTDKTNEKTYT
jgi:hypothetical protein